MRAQEAGVWTVEGVLAVPSKQLACIKGFSDVKVQKLKQAGARARGGGSGGCAASCALTRSRRRFSPCGRKPAT